MMEIHKLHVIEIKELRQQLAAAELRAQEYEKALETIAITDSEVGRWARRALAKHRRGGEA